jgi:hypothetical protein
MTEEEREKRYKSWSKAVERSFGLADLDFWAHKSVWYHLWPKPPWTKKEILGQGAVEAKLFVLKSRKMNVEKGG